MMKKIILLSFLSLSTMGFSQQKTIDTTYVEGNQKITKYTDGSQSIVLIKSNVNATPSKKIFHSPEEEINHLNSYINAIKEKKSHVIATEDVNSPEVISWLNDMNGFIESAENRIAELTEQISQESLK